MDDLTQPIAAVDKVKEVRCKSSAGRELTLEVTAEGQTRTTGWTKVSLTPIHISGSSGSVLHLAFVAVRPQGVSGDAITPVDAKFVHTGSVLTEVVVHAESNSKGAMVP